MVSGRSLVRSDFCQKTRLAAISQGYTASFPFRSKFMPPSMTYCMELVEQRLKLGAQKKPPSPFFMSS